MRRNGLSDMPGALSKANEAVLAFEAVVKRCETAALMKKASRRRAMACLRRLRLREIGVAAKCFLVIHDHLAGLFVVDPSLLNGLFDRTF